MNARAPRLREVVTSQRGEISIEAVLLVPALLLILLLAIVAGRFYIASSSVDEAARSAARAASLARDGGAAATSAEREARAVLGQQGLSCSSVNVSVDASGFTQPLGQTAYVTATVTCQVSYNDLIGQTLPGPTVATATFRSPIDRYGARS